MKITYDKEADAMYIEFTSQEFAKNQKIDNETIIDLDKENRIIGIELLNISKKFPKESFTNISFEGLVAQ